MSDATEHDQPQTEEAPANPREEFTRLVTVIRRSIHGIYRTQLPRMAAALAFRTIFSIIPVLAIGLLIVGSVVSPERVDQGVRRMLDFAGISQITLDDSANEATPDTAQAVVDPVPESESGDGAQDVEEIISDLVLRVNETLADLPTGWIALTSGLVLLYAALSMIIEIEKAFNQVCHAPGGRPWLWRFVIYWCVLTVGTVMLAATFWAGDALADFVQGNGARSAWRAALAGYGVSVLISTVLLVAAYKILPTVRLKLKHLLAGAFLAAVVWELGKWGFTSYLRYSTGYKQFYGSLALLPLFMLWIYVTWIIVLLGLQTAYALQHFHRLIASNGMGDPDGPRIVDPAVVLSLASVLAAMFADGKTPDADRLGTEVGIESEVAESMMIRLEDHGLAHRVVEGDEFRGWVPARPPEKIRARELLDAVKDLEAGAWIGRSEGLRKLAEARRSAAGGQTLRELMGDS